MLAGICAFVAAAVGLVLVASSASRQSPTAITQELHGSFYVIRHHAIWPFIALLFLSAFIAVGGYMHTDRFVNYLIHRQMEKPPDI